MTVPWQVNQVTFLCQPSKFLSLSLSLSLCTIYHDHDCDATLTQTVTLFVTVAVLTDRDTTRHCFRDSDRDPNCHCSVDSDCDSDRAGMTLGAKTASPFSCMAKGRTTTSTILLTYAQRRRYSLS